MRQIFPSVMPKFQIDTLSAPITPKGSSFEFKKTAPAEMLFGFIFLQTHSYKYKTLIQSFCHKQYLIQLMVCIRKWQERLQRIIQSMTSKIPHATEI